MASFFFYYLSTFFFQFRIARSFALLNFIPPRISTLFRIRLLMINHQPLQLMMFLHQPLQALRLCRILIQLKIEDISQVQFLFLSLFSQMRQALKALCAILVDIPYKALPKLFHFSSSLKCATELVQIHFCS